MSHSTDDRRVLAEIERRLARDDPELFALFATLIQQFPPVPEEPRPAARTERRRMRRKPAVILFALIAVLGLLLTALLSAPSSPPPGEDSQPGTHSGSLLTPPAR
ncbi:MULTISPECIES: DUF3040 domain-containing protein [unclassified Streptomyces]|uniref:DUF3040 domain-containing protein n=1 Tax=unclassified Streptomyces TaxID=2593676 RepID=UPI001654D312|nr:DUF3040 domain-containing protein [Streptomyces sp. CB02980]MCB8905478.1 DUF3040 domain-containing protein [Streptomyces sp. CB02980]